MGTKTDSTYFHMCGVQLWIGNTFVDPITAPEAQLLTVTLASLVFATQKNGVHGEVINHACSGATRVCPVCALAHRIIHIRQHTESPIILIASYYHINRKGSGKSQDITSLLHQAIRLIGPNVDLCEDDVSARFLCADGAMSLLCTQVNDNIKLIGRWQSDIMM
jgi:hypothetical protein